MKLRFEVDQADSFRRGIDRPKSIVSIDVNPADIPEEVRVLIADHLAGIDVLQFFYHNGDVVKGYPIRELSCTSRDPKRIVSRAANIEALIEAIRANDAYIARIKASFNHPIQFRLIEKPPKDASEFIFVSDQRGDQLQAVSELIRCKRRVIFECFLDDVQTKLSQLLNEHSYVVMLLPIPGSLASARFYAEPVFAAEYLGRPVVAHAPIIVLNEKTGRLVEARNFFQAIDIYLLHGLRPGTLTDDLSILTWEDRKWVIAAPEGLIEMANSAGTNARNESADQ